MTYRESASTRPHRTAAIGHRSPATASHPLDALIASSLPSPAEQSALIKTKRGIPLTPDDQASMHAVMNRLAGLVGDRTNLTSGDAGSGRSSARPTPSVSAADFRRDQAELERLKRRHRPAAQTVNGKEVAPLATLRTPPATKIFVPSAHR